MNNSSNSEWYPGQIWTEKEEWISLEERATVTLTVKSRGDRPIQVGSHFHFFEVNKVLDFDREKAWGRRLAIPAGTAVRFEPGQSHKVELIDFGGQRVCYGLNGLAGGSLDDPEVKKRALEKAKKKGFKGVK